MSKYIFKKFNFYFKNRRRLLRKKTHPLNNAKILIKYKVDCPKQSFSITLNLTIPYKELLEELAGEIEQNQEIGNKIITTKKLSLCQPTMFETIPIKIMVCGNAKTKI